MYAISEAAHVAVKLYVALSCVMFGGAANETTGATFGGLFIGLIMTLSAASPDICQVQLENVNGGPPSCSTQPWPGSNVTTLFSSESAQLAVTSDGPVVSRR